MADESVLDKIKARVRGAGARTGVSGLDGGVGPLAGFLAGVPFLDGIKSTRSMIREKGILPVAQMSLKGERPIMQRLMPKYAAPQKTGDSLAPPPLPSSSDRRIPGQARSTE